MANLWNNKDRGDERRDLVAILFGEIAVMLVAKTSKKDA